MMLDFLEIEVRTFLDLLEPLFLLLLRGQFHVAMEAFLQLLVESLLLAGLLQHRLGLPLAIHQFLVVLPHLLQFLLNLLLLTLDLGLLLPLALLLLPLLPAAHVLHLHLLHLVPETVDFLLLQTDASDELLVLLGGEDLGRVGVGWKPDVREQQFI